MCADIVKDSFDEANRFSKVIFQRSKDVIDFELNELQDDLRVDKYRSIMDVGGHGSPDNGLFVAASGASNQVTIKAGHFDFHGAHLIFASDTVFSSLTTNPGPGSRTDRIYLSLTESEVADPEQVTELGETTRRRQLVAAFGVAEGTAIPSDSSDDFWEGGTKYIELASILRASGVAAINQVDCTDTRGRLPRAALDMLLEKDQSATTKRSKVIVQALDAETSTNPQLGVRQESGDLAFQVDRLGNVKLLGDTRQDSAAPTGIFRETDVAVDAGGLWRQLFSSGNFALQENTASAGDFSTYRRWLLSDRANNKLISEAHFVPYGATYDLGLVANQWRNLFVDGTADIDTLTLSASAGEGVGSHIYPTAHNTYDLGQSSYAWGNVWATNFNLDGTSKLYVSGGSAYFAVDTNDWLDFIRSSNTYRFVIGSAQALSLTASALTAYTDVVPSANNVKNLGVTGTRWASGYFYNLYATTQITSPRLAVDSLFYSEISGGTVPEVYFDAGDSIAFDRTLNQFVFYVGGTRLKLSSTELTPVVNVVPDTNNTRTLGAPSYRWSTGYFTAVDTGSLTFTGNFSPASDAAQDLGTTSLRWRDVWVSRQVSIGAQTNYFELNAGQYARWNVDVGDLFHYDRTANLFDFQIGSASKFQISTAGIYVVPGRVYLGADDYENWDGSTWSWVLNNTMQMSLSSSMLYVGGNIRSEVSGNYEGYEGYSGSLKIFSMTRQSDSLRLASYVDIEFITNEQGGYGTGTLSAKLRWDGNFGIGDTNPDLRLSVKSTTQSDGIGLSNTSTAGRVAKIYGALAGNDGGCLDLSYQGVLRVQLLGSNNEWPVRMWNDSATGSTRHNVLFMRSHSGGVVVAGDFLGGLAFGGKYDGSNWAYGYNGGAEIRAYNTYVAWSSTSRPALLTIYTTLMTEIAPTAMMTFGYDGYPIVAPGDPWAGDGTIQFGTAGRRWKTVVAKDGYFTQISDDSPYNAYESCSRNGLNAVLARGYVDNGSLSGTHWNVASVSHPSTGTYEITLDVAPATGCTVLVTPAFDSARVWSAYSAASKVTIYFYNLSGAKLDCNYFTFAVIGNPSTTP